MVPADRLYFCTLVVKMLTSFYNQHLVHIRGAFSHRHAYHAGYLLSSGKLGRLQSIMGRQLEWKKTFLGIF